MRTLSTSDIEAVCAKIAKGAQIKMFPLQGTYSPSDDNRHVGSFVFIPCLIAPDSTASVQRAMAKRASLNSQSATDNIPGGHAMFHSDPNEPGRGTITIRVV